MCETSILSNEDLIVVPNDAIVHWGEQFKKLAPIRSILTNSSNVGYELPLALWTDARLREYLFSFFRKFPPNFGWPTVGKTD